MASQTILAAVAEVAGNAAAAPAAGHRQMEKTAHENNKLHKRLCRQVGQAIGDYNMIEDGD